MIHESSRTLNKQELEVLKDYISSRKDLVNTQPLVAIPTALIVSAMAFAFMLWAGPYLAAVAGLVIGGIITYLVHNSEKRPKLANLRRYEDALNYNQAYEWRIQSHQVVMITGRRFDEVLYAYQADESQIVFIDPNYLEGDSDYPDDYSDYLEHAPDNFPNTEFSIVSIIGSDGKAVINGLIYAHGEELEPMRHIQIDRSSGLRRPGHTEMIHGRLDHLELLLRKDEK